jgi:hypothetical protein
MAGESCPFGVLLWTTPTVGVEVNGGESETITTSDSALELQAAIHTSNKSQPKTRRIFHDLLI